MIANQRFAFWKVFWVVFAIYLLFLGLGLLAQYSSGGKMEFQYYFNKWHLLNQVLNVFASSLFFYLTINFYHRSFVRKKNFYYFLRTAVISGVLYASYLYFKRFLVIKEPGSEMTNPAMLAFSLFMFSSFHIGLGLLLSYLTYLRDEKKQQKILEEQKMQLEVEKSSANLNFLKAQINPHFLHNTLNFLYAKSLPYSPELSEGILTLSDIMRYALSEGNAKDGKAPLKDEIEHVWNVIKINQLRFSNKLNVNFNVNGAVNGVTIIPFVLITIVENAFKHGDLKDQDHPIEIELDIEKNRLRFYCRNKKKSGPKELSTGVGLDNIKKRLELAYGNKYAFNIKDDADFYSTELIIHQI